MDVAKVLLLAFVLFTLLPTTGSIAHQEPPGQITFDAIRSAHFQALYVRQDVRPEPATAPLILHVTPIGNVSGIDFGSAARFLREQWNVELVLSPQGLPMVFTDLDLVSRGDPGAVGGAVSSGIAVERGDPRLLPCTIAHEIGHALGLGHSPDSRDLMWTRCTPEKLERATTSAEEVARVARLHSLTAYTLAGPQQWAYRAER